MIDFNLPVPIMVLSYSEINSFCHKQTDYFFKINKGKLKYEIYATILQ